MPESQQWDDENVHVDESACVLTPGQLQRRNELRQTEDAVQRVQASTLFVHGRTWLHAGYNIIPIHPETKSPLVAFKRFMGPTGDRVTDEDIAAWSFGLYRNGDGNTWLGPENPNFAILLDSGAVQLVVADADDPNTFDWCEETFGATPLRTESGRAGGGRHHYYRDDGSGQRCANGMIGPDAGLDWSYAISDETRSIVRGGKWGRTKVDIKSAGGYVLGAGSIHCRTSQPYVGSVPITPELLASLPLFSSEVFAAKRAEHEARKAMRKQEQAVALEARFPRPARVPPARHALRERAIKLVNLPVAANQQVPENLQVLSQCPLVCWTRAHPDGLNYVLRQVLASNIAHLAGQDGRAYYMALLSPHPRFDADEAERIWNKAMEFKDSAPLTYRYALENGDWPGPGPDDVAAPAALVEQVLRVPHALLAKALALESRYAYVLTQDGVYDRQLFSSYGVKAFPRLGSEYRFWLSPAFDSLRPMYKIVTFRTDGVEDPEVLNTFDRERMPRPSGTPTACPPDLWALASNLANGSEREANYMLDWLASRLRFPHKPQGGPDLDG